MVDLIKWFALKGKLLFKRKLMKMTNLKCQRLMEFVNLSFFEKILWYFSTNKLVLLHFFLGNQLVDLLLENAKKTHISKGIFITFPQVFKKNQTIFWELCLFTFLSSQVSHWPINFVLKQIYQTGTSLRNLWKAKVQFFAHCLL